MNDVIAIFEPTSISFLVNFQWPDSYIWMAELSGRQVSCFVHTLMKTHNHTKWMGVNFSPGGGGSSGTKCHRDAAGKFWIWSALGAILSVPEQTSGTLEIFSRAIFLGTLFKFVIIVSLVILELLGDGQGPWKYCNKFLSFQRIFSNAELSIVRRCPSSSSSTFDLKFLFLRNCLITLFLLWHGALLGKYQCTVKCGFGWIILKVNFKGQKGQILSIFHLAAIFSKTVWSIFLYFVMKLPRRVLMDCKKMYLIEALLMSFFKVQKVYKKSNLAVLLLFANFLKNGLITFLYFFCTHLLGDDIDQLSRDGFHWIIQKVIFKVGKVRFSSFSHNYWY